MSKPHHRIEHCVALPFSQRQNFLFAKTNSAELLGNTDGRRLENGSARLGAGSKQRIAVFSVAYLPFVGGAELAIKEITDRSTNREFTLFTNKFGKEWASNEKIGKVDVHRLGLGLEGQKNYYGQFSQKVFYIFRAWRAAEKHHKQNPFSAIWASMASYAGFAALLFKLRHPGVPFLLTLQEGDSEEHILNRVGIFYPIWKMIFKKADYIQAISGYLADFAKRFGARCPIEVVPNGVNLKKIPMGGDHKKNVIITTSRLVHKNGVDTLVRAMDYLKQSVELWILGDGPQRPALELIAKNLKNPAVIKFFGNVDPEEILGWLSQSTVFVRPSRSEGLGSSFLEAMAAGLPIIGTPVGGIPDFLKDGETGIFSRVDDPEDLAKKIDLLISDKKLRDRIAKNGQKLTRENYSWDLISDKMGKIFSSLSETAQKRRILIASGIYPPDLGGPATHVQKLKLAFCDRGLDTKVVTYGDVLETKVESVSRSLPFGLRHLAYFEKCFWLGLRSDIIYAQDATAAGLPAFLAAKLLGKRFFIRIGGDVLWERVAEQSSRAVSVTEYYEKQQYLADKPILFRLIRFILKKSDGIIVPSSFLADLYSKFYGIKGIKVILNPVFPKKSETSSLPEEPTILFAGRFVAYKNLKFLIKVFDQWRQRANNGKLILIGDGPEKQVLEKFIAGLPSANFIEIKSPVSREELPKDIGRASICIGPALTEFNPNFILECLSVGKPVLLSRENGLTVKLPEEFLFDPKKEEELEERISKLLNPKNYQQAVKTIQMIPMEQTWEKVVDEHLKIFNP